VSDPRPWRVAVNLLWCVPGEVGGSEEYLERQLLGLAEAAPGAFDVTVYAPRGYGAAHPEIGRRFELVTTRSSGRSRVGRIGAEHTWLARRTRPADLVHHGGGTTPMVGTRPIVLTIHDLQYLRHPEYQHAAKLRYLSWTIPRSVRRAAVVVTPSEWVRSTVIEAFGVEPDDVLVVRHGIEPARAAVPEPAELRARYALGGGPVIVFPAITHPHKGHRFLLEVMADAWRDPELRLVLLGGRGAADELVEATIDRLDLGDRVIRTGRVPAGDRDGLLSMASALVFPSEYEGFGAPAIEAMALGTPVICADHPALEEVVGDAGLVLPRTVEAWSGALDEVARRRAELVTAGLERAGHFTIAASGAELAAAYRRALERAR